MKLYLTELNKEDIIGIYGPNNDSLANRMRFLHPDAAASYLEISKEKFIKCSDMYRTFEGSLKAHLKKGAARPGYSGHNFGFSIDIDVRWVMRKNGFSDKVELDAWMASKGWHCHNPPGEQRAKEAWHYNYFGDEADKYLAFRLSGKRTWAKPLEEKITDVYGFWWHTATIETVQRNLTKLSLYGGDIDGELGELTETSIAMFQRAWGLREDGQASISTKRTLACVSSDRLEVEVVC